MKSKITLCLLAACAAIGLSGCVTERVAPAPAPIYVQQQPPADIVEVQPPQPNQSTYWTWQRGHWRWNGYRYQWFSGRWIARPPHYTQWTPPHWQPSNRGWVFVEGHWQ